MSNIYPKLSNELSAMEDASPRERNSKRAEIAVNLIGVVVWQLSWWFLWPQFSAFSHGRIWGLPIVGFVCFISSGMVYYFARLAMDRLLKIGWTPPIFSFLRYLTVASIVITVVITALIYAASKTADLIF